EPPPASGSLSKEAIRHVITSHIGEVRVCYEEALASWPDAEGRPQIRYIIDADGSVSAAALVSDSLGYAGLGCCIARAMRDWRFPAPEGGGIIVITYPFLLDQKR